jgi:hypothetical protein
VHIYLCIHRQIETLYQIICTQFACAYHFCYFHVLAAPSISQLHTTISVLKGLPEPDLLNQQSGVGKNATPTFNDRCLVIHLLPFWKGVQDDLSLSLLQVEALLCPLNSPFMLGADSSNLVTVQNMTRFPSWLQIEAPEKYTVTSPVKKELRVVGSVEVTDVTLTLEDEDGAKKEHK